MIGRNSESRTEPAFLLQEDDAPRFKRLPNGLVGTYRHVLPTEFKPHQGASADSCGFGQLVLRQPKRQASGSQKVGKEFHGANLHARARNTSLSTIAELHDNIIIRCAFFCHFTVHFDGSDPWVGLTFSESEGLSTSEREDKMDVLALGGSKGGGSRTTSSVLLEAGARELALHPLRIRVLPPGRAPALRNVRQVPFDTASISTDDAETRHRSNPALVQRSPECFPVIVNMLCKRIRTTMHMLAGIKARILLPIRDRAGKLANRP